MDNEIEILIMNKKHSCVLDPELSRVTMGFLEMATNERLENSGIALPQKKEGMKMIGELLKSYREQNKLSFVALGKQTGISAPTLCRIENNGPVSKRIMTDLVDWMFHKRIRTVTFWEEK